MTRSSFSASVVHRLYRVSHTIMNIPPGFDKEIRDDTLVIVTLWKVDGSRSANIEIRKHVHGHPEDTKTARLTYHIHDQTRENENSRCTAVNKRPIWSLSYALQLANEREVRARKDGAWVDQKKLQFQIAS